jgi:hypothetical protein
MAYQGRSEILPGVKPAPIITGPEASDPPTKSDPTPAPRPILATAESKSDDLTPSEPTRASPELIIEERSSVEESAAAEVTVGAPAEGENPEARSKDAAVEKEHKKPVESEAGATSEKTTDEQPASAEEILAPVEKPAPQNAESEQKEDMKEVSPEASPETVREEERVENQVSTIIAWTTSLALC